MTATPATPSTQEALTTLGVTSAVRSFVPDLSDRLVCLLGDTSAKHYVRLVGANEAQTAL